MRHHRSGTGAAVAAIAAMLTVEAAAIEVAVDQNTTYQTIEGIGVAQDPATFTPTWRYRSGPFYVSVDYDEIHFYDTVIVDGGFTAMRADPITAFQPTPGDFAVTGGVRAELEAEARFVEAARGAGEPFMILWNCFSPPAWMKANNSQAAQAGTWGDLYQDPNNYLLSEHYADFANHWVRLMEIARDSFGVTVDCISLQNEPLFNEPYASCNYAKGPGCGWNGICYNNMFRVVAPVIKAAFPAVKLIASEDLNRTTVEVALRNDAVSNPLVYAWATHNDYVSSFAYWPDRPTWNTEPHSMGFLDEAQMCMANLSAGASVWMTGANGGRTNGCCDTAGTNNTDCLQTGVYSAIKMFARYVRPGARRIGSTGTVSGNYGVIAFHHPQDECLSIVLINATAAAEPATLSVTGAFQPAQFEAYYSTAGEDEVHVGAVAADGVYSMPPYSVSTLVAGTYSGTSTVRVPQSPGLAGAHRGLVKQSLAVYTIDGRRALDGEWTPHRPVAGVYLEPGRRCLRVRCGSAVSP